MEFRSSIQKCARNKAHSILANLWSIVSAQNNVKNGKTKFYFAFKRQNKTLFQVIFIVFCTYRGAFSALGKRKNWKGHARNYIKGICVATKAVRLLIQCINKKKNKN